MNKIMSKETISTINKAIQIMEEKGFVHHSSPSGAGFIINCFSKKLACGIKDCKIPLILYANITSDQMAFEQDILFEFKLNHHDIRERYGKRIEFNNFQVKNRKKKDIVLKIFEKAIDHVQDNIDKFGDFVKEDKGTELSGYQWFDSRDVEVANPLDYYYFYMSPKFKEDEITFKTCEIDENLLYTEAVLKFEKGHRGLVIRRF